MSFASIDNNQTVSYANLQDAVSNGVFTLVSSITSTGQESTKSYVAAHVSGFSTTYPKYANKSSNQLIVKSDIYNPGYFFVNTDFGIEFASITGTNIPAFSYPITINDYRIYNGTIPAQTMNMHITGDPSGYSIGLYVDSILVDVIQGTDIPPNGRFSLSLPNSVNSPSYIYIQLNIGTTPVPPVPPTSSTFTGLCFSTVSVNRGSGQYMVAGNTNLYSSSGWTAGYLFYSTNYGSSWAQTTTFGYWIKIASSDSGQYVLAIEAYGKAYLSTNYGASFNVIASLGSLSYTNAALSNDGHFMITVNPPFGYSVVYGSSDYGANWSTILAASGFESYYSCAIDSSSNIYLVGGGVGGQSFLYKSTNHGASWSTVFTNSTGASVNDMNIYAGGGVALASQYGTSSAGSNLILSTNSGSSWSNITGSSAIQSWVRVIIAESANIGYAIPQLGNSNVSYIQKVSGLLSSPSISSLTSAGSRNWHSLACSNSGSYILAGEGTGLWLSTNGGTSFTQL